MNVYAWLTISGFACGVVGYWIGYSAASRRAAYLINMFRMETEMYLGVLSKKDEPL